MQNAVLETKRKPVYTLSEILAFKTVPVLKKVASCHGVKGTTGFTKPELITAITPAMLDESKIADTLTLTDDEEWTLFQKAASCRELPAEEAPEYDPIFLMGIGYLEAFRHNDKLVFVVPDEIKQALNSLMQSGYEEERSYITQLNKYALAATSLYGVITIDDFVELFNSQNERKTNVDDVCSLLLRFISLDAGYCYWEEYIVHDGFEANDFKDVGRIAKKAASKQRYLPAKEEFLKFADDTTKEITPQMSERWDNGGHSSNELADKIEMPTTKQLPVRSKKIGRNEPCPCGSGKKYKKCCL